MEEQVVVAIAGGNGRHGTVAASFAVTNSRQATIAGTARNVTFREPFVFPASFVVRSGDGEHRREDLSGLTGREGLAWQTTAIPQDIHDGRAESPVHSLTTASP